MVLTPATENFTSPWSSTGPTDAFFARSSEDTRLNELRREDSEGISAKNCHLSVLVVMPEQVLEHQEHNNQYENDQRDVL